jgi:hypothetical protein
LVGCLSPAIDGGSASIDWSSVRSWNG